MMANGDSANSRKHHLIQGVAASAGESKDSSASTSASASAKRLSSHRAASRDVSHQRFQLTSTSNRAQTTKEMLCSQCYTQQNKFYCHTRCLPARISAHRDEVRRLSRTRDAIAEQVRGLLGLRYASSQTMHTQGKRSASGEPGREMDVRARNRLALASVSGPSKVLASASTFADPFVGAEDTLQAGAEHAMEEAGPPVAAHRYADVASRSRRALAEALQQTSDSANRSSFALRDANASQWKRIESRRQALDVRKSMLRNATTMLAVHRDESTVAKPIQAGPGAWPWLQESSVSNDSSTPGSQIVGVMSGCVTRASLDGLRAQVKGLERIAEQQADDLRKIRASRVREICSIFTLSPPAASFASVAAAGTQQSSGPSILSMARAQRSRERYHSESTDQERERSLGGFDPRSGPPTASRGIVAAANAALANARTAHAHDWTVVGNVLPMPSDIRRFPRDAINGATEYTSQLIELVAAYLGLQLPFAFVNDAGALTARQCPLWSRSKIPEVSLYLSNSAYDVLTSPSPLSGGPSSLAMSTLSTLESFVQLPGGNHFSWGLASVLGGNAGRSEAGSALQDDAPNKRISASQNQSQARNAAAVSSRAAAIIGGEDPANSAAFNFVQLLTIIAYNAAFIAQKQGVGVDLHEAAGSTLRLLSRAVTSPELGRYSHASFHGSSHLKGMSMVDLDFDKLHQRRLLPLLGSKEEGAERSKTSNAHKPASSSVRQAPESSSKRASRKSIAQPPIMEESYVDAQRDVASFLDVRDVKSTRSQLGAVGDSPAPSSGSGQTARERGPARHAARGGAQDGMLPYRGPPAAKSSAVPPTLDFLASKEKTAKRYKSDQSGTSGASSVPPGARESKEASEAPPPSTLPNTIHQQIKAARRPRNPVGGVTFNGVEVGATLSEPSDDENWYGVPVNEARGETDSSSPFRSADVALKIGKKEDEWHVI